MHIKVNVYANTVTLTHTHIPVWLWCVVDLNGLCCNESSPIKCVFVRVTQRLFPITDKPKASTPWSPRRRMDVARWEERALKEIKRKSCVREMAKERPVLVYSKSQRYKRRQGSVMSHWLWKTKAGKQTGIHAKNQMWKEEAHKWRGGDSWARAVITQGPYRWLWLIAPKRHATPIKSITHSTLQPLHSLMQLLLYAAPFPLSLMPLI